MTKLCPATLLLPRADSVDSIVAPPYDVLTRAKAHRLCQANPQSIVHITRPDAAEADAITANSETMYAQAKQHFVGALNAKRYQSQVRPGFGLYQISGNGAKQTGIIAAANPSQLKTHEHTLANKVTDRLELTKALDAQVSPVLLTYRHQAALREVIASLCHKTASYFDHLDTDGYRHQLWFVNEASLSAHLSAIEALYVADGHHRTACMQAFNQQMGHDTPIISVAFADDELSILGYHRLIQDEAINPKELLFQLEKIAEIKPLAMGFVPEAPHQFGLYMENQWYALMVRENRDALPSARLHDDIIGPLLGITDCANDKRIRFVGGNNAIDTIEQAVNSGKATLGLSLSPTPIHAILAAADKGEILPPKSTWFEPKLLDGFFIYPHDTPLPAR